jgi:hypothetical protein
MKRGEEWECHHSHNRSSDTHRERVRKKKNPDRISDARALKLRARGTFFSQQR